MTEIKLNGASVSRNNQPSASHQFPATTSLTILLLNVSTAQFLSNTFDWLPQHCGMAAPWSQRNDCWASPKHFHEYAVQNAYRTATRRRAELGLGHIKERRGVQYISSVSRLGRQTPRQGQVVVVQPRERGGEQHSSEPIKLRRQPSILPKGSVLQRSGTKLAAMATRSVALQTEDPISGALCGTGSRPRQSLPQPPKRWMMGARCTNGGQSRSSIGWS